MDLSGDGQLDPFRDAELDAALASTGPLPADVATRLLQRGRALLEAAEAHRAIADFRRVIGHPDPALTGAAMLGAGDALYRLDAERDAAGMWSAVTELPENPSTYRAWRNLAGVHVRGNDLTDAIEAYREADRRAPAEDRAEIAARLGWLAKETGNAGAANRYFAKSRGTAGLSLSLLVLIATAAISLMAETEPRLLDQLLLDKSAVAEGELYRLLTVTLVHGGPLHLVLNLYALWIVGPIVESIWGRTMFAVFYVLTALVASTASFLTSSVDAVGASGAIFGLVGVILAGTRAHHPALDRRARSIVPQLGMFVIINLAFGLFSTGFGINIDNAAHIGGLVAGLWLGFVVPPDKVPSLRTAFQQPRGQQTGRSPILVAAGVVALVGVVAAGLALGGVPL